MGFDWHALVGWAVTLLSGFVTSGAHKLADRFPHHRLSKYFSARDPPLPRPPRVPFTDEQLLRLTGAVMEGNTPMVRALSGFTAELAAWKNLLQGGLTITARPPPLPPIPVNG